jgi:predicted regulator of Ras-like GTPase activity (Roadblock/LC7/MglB family)
MSSGKRYSPDEIEEIMQYRQNHTYQETQTKYSVSQMTLARWSRKFKKLTQSGDHFIGDPVFKIPLQVLKYLEGVKAVAIYSDMSDGSSGASILDNNVSEDALFLAMISILAASERSKDDLDMGKLEMILTKHTEGLFLIVGISATWIMAILFDGKKDLGKLINQDYSYIDRIRKEIKLITDTK